MRYIALLRGVNVGGKNTLPMPKLKAAFEQAGFTGVATYINSGNVLFSSGEEDAVQLTARCEALIAERFGIEIPVAVLTAHALVEAMDNAPAWWGADREAVHNAIFVLPPATVPQLLEWVGETKPEVERVGRYGCVIFWSVPVKSYSRTRLSTVVGRAAQGSITVRNANTARKLAQLARG